MSDLSAWLTTAEVCERLGTTERTLERQKATWQTRLRPRPGKRPERVYDPQQVADRAPGPHTELLRNGWRAEPETAIAPVAPELPSIPPSDKALTLSSLASLADLFRTLLDNTGKPAPIVAAAPLWITLEEASEVTGLSVGFLKRMIAGGQLSAIKGGPHGSWRVRRASLDDATFEQEADVQFKFDSMARGDE